MAPVARAYNDDNAFRGISLDKLRSPYVRMDWTLEDHRVFAMHAARYQITSTGTFMPGIDDLSRDLGIYDQTDDYKQVIFKHAKPAIKRLVDMLKKNGVLVQHTVWSNTTHRRVTIWKWPEYTRDWLRPDWNGSMSPPDGILQSGQPRRDPPGQRAATPGRDEEPYTPPATIGINDGHRDEMRDHNGGNHYASRGLYQRMLDRWYTTKERIYGLLGGT